MTDETREPTPVEVQQARLVEESIRDAIKLFQREGIPPACIATGLKMATFRFETEVRGPPPDRTN